MNRKQLSHMVALFAAVLLFGGAALSLGAAAQRELSCEVFRLHIIANSDSAEDQTLKFKVRDALLAQSAQWANDGSRDQMEQQVGAHLNEIEELCESVLRESGYDYSVSAVIEDREFPTKTYGDVSLPAGTYRALDVTIGAGEGHNWWCVLYPPLCLSVEEEKDLSDLSDPSAALVQGDRVFAFKLAELAAELGLN